MNSNTLLYTLNNETSSGNNASSSASSSSLSHIRPESINRINCGTNHPKLQTNWTMTNSSNNNVLNNNNSGLFSSSCTPSPIHPQFIMLNEQQQQQQSQHRRNSASATPKENSLSSNNTLLKNNTTHITMFGGNNSQMYPTNNNIRDNTPSNFITGNIQLPLSSSSYNNNILSTNYDHTNSLAGGENSISSLKQMQLQHQQLSQSSLNMYVMPSNFHNLPNINIINQQTPDIQQPQHLLSNSSSSSSLIGMGKDSGNNMNDNTNNATIMKPMFSYKDVVQNENIEQLPLQMMSNISTLTDKQPQVISPIENGMMIDPMNNNIQQQLVMGMANMNMNTHTFIPQQMISNNIQPMIIHHNLSNTNLAAMANMKSCSITPVAPIHMQIPNNNIQIPFTTTTVNPTFINNMNMNMINNQYTVHNTIPTSASATTSIPISNINHMNMNIMNMSMSSLLSNENTMVNLNTNINANQLSNNTSNVVVSDHPKLSELSAKLNPNVWPLNPRLAKFFVIKSFGEDDVHKSIKYSLWCSTGRGNRKLDEAFADSERLVAGSGNDSRDQINGCPIYLFFSVNRSGCFCGMAQMISCYDENRHFTSWVQDDKWQGSFMVKWIFVKDIPNKDLKDITLPNNDHRPVTFSRDTQEIPFTQGIQLLQRFVEYKPKTNILQDFQYYDDREKDMYNIMMMNNMSGGMGNSTGGYFDNGMGHGHGYHHQQQQSSNIKQFQRDGGYHSSYVFNNNRNTNYKYMMYGGHEPQNRYDNQYRKTPVSSYDNNNNRYNNGSRYYERGNGRGKGRNKGRNKRSHHHHHQHYNNEYKNQRQRKYRSSNVKSDDQQQYQILKRQRNDKSGGGSGGGRVILGKTQSNVSSVGNDMNKD